MKASRICSQLQFLAEIDKLKGVLRHSRVSVDGRRENDAEHSWHLALLVMILSEYGAPDLDRLRILEMVLVHDLVEIDAGDTIAYASAAEKKAQAEREARAAARIFGLLPPDQARRVGDLFDEFEQGQSAEARAARALDRMQPVLQNLNTGGSAWRQNGITAARVRALNEPRIRAFSDALWEHIDRELRLAEARGCFADPE